jgi:hypothetical protein
MLRASAGTRAISDEEVRMRRERDAQLRAFVRVRVQNLEEGGRESRRLRRQPLPFLTAREWSATVACSAVSHGSHACPALRWIGSENENGLHRCRPFRFVGLGGSNPDLRLAFSTRRRITRSWSLFVSRLEGGLEARRNDGLFRFVPFFERRDQDRQNDAILWSPGFGLHGDERRKIEHAKQASFIGHGLGVAQQLLET